MECSKWIFFTSGELWLFAIWHLLWWIFNLYWFFPLIFLPHLVHFLWFSAAQVSKQWEWLVWLCWFKKKCPRNNVFVFFIQFFIFFAIFFGAPKLWIWWTVVNKVNDIWIPRFVQESADHELYVLSQEKCQPENHQCYKTVGTSKISIWTGKINVTKFLTHFSCHILRYLETSNWNLPVISLDLRVFSASAFETLKWLVKPCRFSGNGVWINVVTFGCLLRLADGQRFSRSTAYWEGLKETMRKLGKTSRTQRLVTRTQGRSLARKSQGSVEFAKQLHSCQVYVSSMWFNKGTPKSMGMNILNNFTNLVAISLSS